MSISPSARVASYSLIEPREIISARVCINGLTRIGCNNVIGQFSTIGEVKQDLKYAGEATDVALGDRNRIGKNAIIHHGTVEDYRQWQPVFKQRPHWS